MFESILANIISAAILVILSVLGITAFYKKIIIKCFSKYNINKDKSIKEKAKQQIIQSNNAESSINQAMLYLNHQQFYKIESYLNLPVIEDDELIIDNVKKIQVFQNNVMKEIENAIIHISHHKPPTKYFLIYIDDLQSLSSTIALNFSKIDKINNSYSISNEKQHYPLLLNITAYSNGYTDYKFTIRKGFYNILDCYEALNFFNNLLKSKEIIIKEKNGKIKWKLDSKKIMESSNYKSEDYYNWIELLTVSYKYISILIEQKIINLKNIPIYLTKDDITISHNLYKYYIEKNYLTKSQGFDAQFIKNPQLNSIVLKNVFLNKKILNMILRNDSHVSTYNYLSKQITYKGIYLEYDLLTLKHKVKILINYIHSFRILGIYNPSKTDLISLKLNC